MRFRCVTTFDITATGVTGHFKADKVPFRDRAGQTIQNQISWNMARNQQRNWETLTQVIGLRTQIYRMTPPARIKHEFEFVFETETADSYGPQDNPTQMLLTDAEGVPMIKELWNLQDINSVLTTSGDRQNIWFTVLS